MNYYSLETYLLPLLLIAFFGYKIYRFYAVKKQLPGMLEAGAIIVDVRSPSEFNSSHNPKSINIPLDQVNSKSNQLDKNKPIILCCASGTRSGIAVGLLKKNGFKNVINAGPWTNTIIS
jgi:rhodanese-related sulfurtransferase